MKAIHKVLHKNDKFTMCKDLRLDDNYSTKWDGVTCKNCLKHRGPGAGPPTKWKDEFLSVVFELKSKYYTNPQIARVLGVDNETFRQWLMKNQKLIECVKEAEQHALQRVERSLFERATGYKHRETKLFSYQGQIVSQDIIKHCPPDVNAIQYFLNNKHPDTWKSDAGLRQSDAIDVIDGEVNIGFSDEE